MHCSAGSFFTFCGWGFSLVDQPRRICVAASCVCLVLQGRYSGAIRCINYCVQRGATVLNHSWAGGNRSESLYQAFLNAEKAGAFHIIAAGKVLAR